MLKWNEMKLTEAGRWYCVGCCLAADPKPAGLANGSQLVEMDTGKLFFYDEENSRWRQFGGAA
jgi:hypothetical protein